MITQARLKELLHYNPETGVFTNLKKRGVRGSIGDVVGGVHYGYYRIRIDSVNYNSHKLAWLYVYGEFPSSNIDHINRIKTDNRLCNLRLATKQQNNWNVGLRKDNTSGYKGVTFCKKTKKWIAKMAINKKSVTLAYFALKDDAKLYYDWVAQMVQGDYRYD